MGIARTSGFLIGTSSTVGDTIANGASDTGLGIVDLLGNDTSIGEADLYLYATSTVTVGTIDVYFNKQQESGGTVLNATPDLQITPINGTVKYFLGRISVGRYFGAKIINNATGASLTNVSLGYDLYKAS